jgi:hypothetical protein
MLTGEEEVQLHSFEASELEGSEWSALCPNRLTPWGLIPSFPLNKRIDALQGRYGVSEKIKISCPTRITESPILYPKPLCKLQPVFGKIFKIYFENSVRVS